MAQPIVEEATVDGKDYRVIWHGSDFEPPRKLTVQCSGVCFTPSSEVIVVAGSEDANWSLPGGHPERGESLRQAFIREVREEACAIVKDSAYLGCQEVHELVGCKDTGTYYSARFWGRVELAPFRPQFETVRRKCVRPDELRDALRWSTVRCLEAMLEAALEAQRNRTPGCNGPQISRGR